MAEHAGKIEANDQVVEIAVAAAEYVFKAPRVETVVPQVADVFAVAADLVGQGKAPIDIARAVVSELEGNQVASIDDDLGLGIVTAPCARDRRAVPGSRIRARMRRRRLARSAWLQHAD